MKRLTPILQANGFSLISSPPPNTITAMPGGTISNLIY